MAKRSYSTLDNKPSIEPPDPIFTPKLDIDPKPSVTYNKVTNLIPSRVIRYGKVSGTRYEWQPGQTINVLSEDTDELRNLKLGGRPCCAGGDANSIFQVLED